LGFDFSQKSSQEDNTPLSFYTEDFTLPPDGDEKQELVMRLGKGGGERCRSTREIGSPIGRVARQGGIFERN